MADGVRAFMLDVYDVLGTPTLYHGTLLLGSQPLEDVFLIELQQGSKLPAVEKVMIVSE